MTRYERVIQLLDDTIGGPNSNIGVHGAFWRGLTRDQFVTQKVFNRDLVVVGSWVASNLVKALKGEAPFGADLPDPLPGAQFSRMPAGLPPMPDADVAFIQTWIDAGSPEDSFTPNSEPVPARVAVLEGAPSHGRVFDDLEPLESVGQTSMMITVPEHASRLTVRIWDRFGDQVRTPVDEADPSSGSRTLMWDRTDEAGQPLPPEYFIWRVTVDETSESRLVQVKAR